MGECDIIELNENKDDSNDETLKISFSEDKEEQQKEEDTLDPINTSGESQEESTKILDASAGEDTNGSKDSLNIKDESIIDRVSDGETENNTTFDSPFKTEGNAK